MSSIDSEIADQSPVRGLVCDLLRHISHVGIMLAPTTNWLEDHGQDLARRSARRNREP